MRDLLVDFNRYLSKYKYVIGFLVLAVILFLLVARQYDKMANKVGDSSNNTTISESVYNDINVNQVSQNDNIKKVQDVSKYINSEKDLVDAFYKLCKDNKLELAYEMISDDCKQLLYPTVEDFKNNYYNVIFKTNKDIEIISFKNNTYRVNFFEEAISIGSSQNTGIVDYVTVCDDDKLNISGYIGKEQMDVSSIQEYFSIQIIQKLVFVDYEQLSITVKNNTKADIYINDASQSGLYISDSKGKLYDVESGEYYDHDYYIPAQSKKTINIRFNKKYNVSSSTKSISFNSIKIVNKKYYDNSNGQYIEKKTNYPNKTSVTIDFEE